MFPAKEIIKKRKSTRTFDGRPLSNEDRNLLSKYIDELNNPWGVKVNFRLLDAAAHNLSSPVIVGEDTYIAAKVARTGSCELAFGYEFEKVCLYAESIGLGTVMLAASLSRKTFEKAMELEANEVFPLASPVGYPAAKRSMRETVMRKALKADDRIAFNELYFDGSFDKGLTPDKAGDFAEALEMARWAPSAGNKQPWRAVVDGSKVHFYEQKSMKDSELGDIPKVDVGIALSHFELVMQENGFTGSFKEEDPGIAVLQDTYYITSYERSR